MSKLTSKIVLNSKIYKKLFEIFASIHHVMRLLCAIFFYSYHSTAVTSLYSYSGRLSPLHSVLMYWVRVSLFDNSNQKLLKWKEGVLLNANADIL